MLFRVARRGLLTIQRQRADTKYWRPSLLVLLRAGPLAENAGIQHLLGFLDRAKASGLLVIGHAQIGEQAGEIPTHSELFAELSAASPGLEGFPQAAIAPTGRLACMNLLLGAGLGSMVPDTVAVVLPQSEYHFEGESGSRLPFESAEELLGVMHDIMRLERNLLVAANFQGQVAREGAPARVDLWAPPGASVSRPGLCTSGLAARRARMGRLAPLAQALRPQLQETAPAANWHRGGVDVGIPRCHKRACKRPGRRRPRRPRRFELETSTS